MEPEQETQTGVDVVDDVLRSVQAIDDRPVDEHVAVFEQAHEQLRRVLDTAGQDVPATSGG